MQPKRPFTLSVRQEGSLLPVIFEIEVADHELWPVAGLLADLVEDADEAKDKERAESLIQAYHGLVSAVSGSVRETSSGTATTLRR